LNVIYEPRLNSGGLHTPVLEFAVSSVSWQKMVVQNYCVKHDSFASHSYFSLVPYIQRQALISFIISTGFFRTIHSFN
jgi:hypothetical protein